MCQCSAKSPSRAMQRSSLACVMLKDRKNTHPNAAVDVIARAEDASKIQRITERFKLATVNRADVSLDIQRDRDKMFPKDKSVKEALRGGAAAEERSPAASERTVAEDQRTGSADESMQPDPERDLPPSYDEEPTEGRRIMGGPKKEESEINPSLAKTDRDHLSEPNSTRASRSNGFPGKTERPSVREKLNIYKAESTRAKAEKSRELANDVVSRGLDAAKDAAKLVPVPRAPGRER